MGDLRRGDASRGQLLIITALTLAVLLSVLTLTLNTAVFGGAYVAQTDEGVRAESGATGFQAAVERGVAGLIPRVNDQHDDYDTLRAGLVDGTAEWTGLAGGEYARDSVATNASVGNVTYETRVFQNSTQQFTDNATPENADWTVAANTSNASSFDMTVNDDELASGEPNGCINDSSNCFTVTVENASGATWTMYLYEDTTIALTVVDANGNVQNRTASGPVEINVTAGQFDVADTNQSFTSYADATGGVEGPYTITYTDANNVEGTYNLTVAGRVTPGTIDGNDSYALVGGSGSPFADPRITAANVSVQYESSTLRYGSTVRVTPGDGDD